MKLSILYKHKEKISNIINKKKKIQSRLDSNFYENEKFIESFINKFILLDNGFLLLFLFIFSAYFSILSIFLLLQFIEINSFFSSSFSLLFLIIPFIFSIFKIKKRRDKKIQDYLSEKDTLTQKIFKIFKFKELLINKNKFKIFEENLKLITKKEYSFLKNNDNFKTTFFDKKELELNILEYIKNEDEITFEQFKEIVDFFKLKINIDKAEIIFLKKQQNIVLNKNSLIKTI